MKKLEESVALLEKFKKGEHGNASDPELWRAQKVKQAILHPDTGQKVFAPFRMSGFVPFGWITLMFFAGKTDCGRTGIIDALRPIIRPLLEYASELCNPMSSGLVKLIEKVKRSFTRRILARAGHPLLQVTGMLLPNPSTPTLLFWQWMNQSHNACVNYANRNATQPQPTSKFLGAYAVAVSAAMSVSLGLTTVLNRLGPMKPSTRTLLSRFVPLPATSLASSLNVIAMRAAELDSGIDVYDESGRVVGVSKVAAKQAVIETTITRAFLPVPLLLIPPCILPVFERYAWVKATVPRHIFVQATVCALSFAFSLPIALALFPQESSIATSSLEMEIQKKTDHSTLFFNKGL